VQGLYKYLEGSSSTLDAEVYTKASMVAMSHSVEKVVKEYNLYADIYVLFQEYKFFLYERERYLELDKVCRQIFVFAKDIPDNAAQDFEKTTFINLSDDSPLLKEWSVIVVHPDYSAVLATKEDPTLQKINKDDYRIFKGFLSLDAEVAENLAKYYHNLLEQQGVFYSKEDWQPEELNNKKTELKKLISLFINDSLFELEDKLRSLEEKEMRLDAMVADNKELSREIMQKPGKLTAEEYEVMQNYPEIGAKILEGSHSEVLNMAYNIAYSHHEKWDGSGYPQGIKEKEIPVEARIVGLADVFDALSSKRVYKDAFSRKKCVEIVSSERNQHFQAEILDILLENLDEIYDFRRDLKEFSDSKTVREISDYFFSVDFSIFEFLKMREMLNS